MAEPKIQARSLMVQKLVCTPSFPLRFKYIRASLHKYQVDGIVMLVKRKINTEKYACTPVDWWHVAVI